jgi:hypothetical protein
MSAPPASVAEITASIADAIRAALLSAHAFADPPTGASDAASATFAKVIDVAAAAAAVAAVAALGHESGPRSRDCEIVNANALRVCVGCNLIIDAGETAANQAAIAANSRQSFPASSVKPLPVVIEKLLPARISWCHCPDMRETQSYVDIMHFDCFAARQLAVDRLVGTPVPTNIQPTSWPAGLNFALSKRAQDQYRALRRNWMYSHVGQGKAEFDLYCADKTQVQFRLTNVGFYSARDTVSFVVGVKSFLSEQPFTFELPLLHDIDASRPADVHVSRRPQLWVCKSTLPFSLFRDLYTFTFATRIAAASLPRMSDHLRMIRDTIGNTEYTVDRDITMIRDENGVDRRERATGRYWYQEAYDKRYFIVARLRYSTKILLELYQKLVLNPRASDSMLWKQWGSQIGGSIQRTRIKMQMSFVQTVAAITATTRFKPRSDFDPNVELRLSAGASMCAPVSSISILTASGETGDGSMELHIKSNCVSLNAAVNPLAPFNSQRSRDSSNTHPLFGWFVFPPERDANGTRSEGRPIAYQLNSKEIGTYVPSDEGLNRSMPVVYDADLFVRTYCTSEQSVPMTVYVDAPGVEITITHEAKRQ